MNPYLVIILIMIIPSIITYFIGKIKMGTAGKVALTIIFTVVGAFILMMTIIAVNAPPTYQRYSSQETVILQLAIFSGFWLGFVLHSFLPIPKKESDSKAGLYFFLFPMIMICPPLIPSLGIKQLLIPALVILLVSLPTYLFLTLLTLKRGDKNLSPVE